MENQFNTLFRSPKQGVDNNYRTNVYNQFRQYALQKDDRTMDEICNRGGEFELQIQQKFLSEFLYRSYNFFTKMMLYHEIGSGKTCTSIVLAEKYLEINPTHGISVILPARLKSNFIDELISPCGFNKYITPEEAKLYKDPTTSVQVKKNIRRNFMARIDKFYTIMSFEKFKSSALNAPNLLEWVNDLTKNKMVIIDEAHNLSSGLYNNAEYVKMYKTASVPRTSVKGIMTMLFKYLGEKMSPSSKMLLLTATPIFDNIDQLKTLASVINPAAYPTTVKGAIKALEGKVTYFPGVSPNAYPTHTVVNVNVPMSNTIADEMYKIQEEEEQEDEDKNSFLIKQRQTAICYYPGNNKVTSRYIQNVLNDLDEYAPKLKMVASKISEYKKCKHVVYCSFIQRGLLILENILIGQGWISIKKLISIPIDQRHIYNYKVYVVWDGSMNDTEKELVKALINNIDNIGGKFIRVVLGSPSIKEGVSFKHVQHLHIIDPVWNLSALNQIQGRVLRFCSHVDIPINHPTLKRSVEIHPYIIKWGPYDMGTFKTCDEHIYEDIIPKKAELVTIAEEELKKVSIDYFLFRNLYKPNGKSPINDMDVSPYMGDANIRNRVVRDIKSKSTCPKKRRPDPFTGACSPGSESRKNKNGDDCCYVVKKKSPQRNGRKSPSPKKKASTCPPKRRPDPVTGLCAAGSEPRKNKNGDDCCYVVKKKRSTK
jgi:hypothetical protein